MASLDQMLKVFKRKMVESGLTEVEDPDDLANQLFEMVKSRRMNTEAADDNLPIFSTSGIITEPDEIDDNFETLDVCSGE